MPEKIVGYLLLLGGVAAIILTAINIYLVFSRQAKPIQFFDLPAIKIDTSSITPTQLSNNSKSNNTSVEIFPKEAINDSSNLFAHLLLMGFIAGAGQKIATLGIQLLRPIEVKVKAKNNNASWEIAENN